MDHAEQTIPVRAARLIIQYLHNTLSEAQTKELDDWMGISDENQELFEQLTEGVDDNVFSADELLIETEQAIDFWVIAGLVLRRQQQLNDEIEERRLDDWISASPHHAMMYQKLQSAAFMQSFLNWARPLIKQRMENGGNN